MKNWEYADLSHNAALNGGPQKFCDKCVQKGIQIGKHKMTPVVVVVGLAALALGGVVGYLIGRRGKDSDMVTNNIDNDYDNDSAVDANEDCDINTDHKKDLKSELAVLNSRNKKIYYLTNLHLESDDEKCEIDGLVFTEKGVYILENVKSVENHILSNCAAAEYDSYAYRIENEMEKKTRIIRKILHANEGELRIMKALIFKKPFFYNNESSDINAVPFNCLIDYITEKGFPVYTAYGIHEMYEIVKMNNQRKE